MTYKTQTTGCLSDIGTGAILSSMFGSLVYTVGKIL